MLFVWTQAPADHDHQVDASGDTFVPDLPQTAAGEELTLTCYFTPLVLSTMSKYSDESHAQYTVSIITV